MRTDATEDPATGFRITPAGEFSLRDYGHEDPADLKALHGLLEEILIQHKTLIPGIINRLVIQWHADVRKALDNAPSGGNRRQDGQ